MKFSEFPPHHAVVVTHPLRNEYGARLWEELRTLSPAHKFFNQTVLDIETARAITSFAQSAYNGEKIALISFHTASIPAQNALLKTFEEPRDGVRFILLTTDTSNLLGTVLSRTHHIQLDEMVSDRHAREFLSTTPAFRIKLSFITDVLARVDEEGRKDRESVKGFVLSLLPVLKESRVDSRYVTEVLEVASYASDPSASGKALLEYLALYLPEVR